MLLALAAAPGRAAGVTFKFTGTADGKPIANAVVSLVPLDASVEKPPPASPAEVTQIEKEFAPQVIAVTIGTTVKFSNREKSGNHHIYSLSEAKKFEIPLHKPGTETAIVFDRAGVIALGCNIHEWMRAYVVVLATPWFATSDVRGSAAVDAPPGRYRAEVWHARLEKMESREIALPAAGPVGFTLALSPDKRIPRGPTAAGAGYK